MADIEESVAEGWEQKWGRKWGYRKRKWAYLSSEVFPVGMTYNAEMFHTVHDLSHHKHIKKLGNNPLGNVKETRRRMQQLKLKPTVQQN